MNVEQLAERVTVTVPEAGQVLGIGRDAAYAAAHRGEIPTLKLGHRLVVPVPRLLSLLGVTTPGDDEAGPATGPALATIHVLAKDQESTHGAPAAAP